MSNPRLGVGLQIPQESRGPLNVGHDEGWRWSGIGIYRKRTFFRADVPKPGTDPVPNTIEPCHPTNLFINPDDAVPGALPFFPYVPYQHLRPMPLEPTDCPVQPADTISADDAKSLVECGKEFFRRMVLSDVRGV